ncbi:GTP cyclohydrolase I FolE [Oligoflexus tunisiensis]|uniref:GTP cyclohydrolase I FolE n=1 Tax=Oligoflexus tunisiensis TaxID=708132 RepID=UPI003F764367
MAHHIRSVLILLGEDPDREGLVKTPMRFATAMLDLTSGYRADFGKITNEAVFSQTDSGMVLVRDIELFSLCEHHMLPFYGKAHVAYLPSDKVIGLSKIPRIVDAFAQRLQIQERLSQQIAQELMERIAPRGAAVIIEAYHMCVMMRGVEKQASRTVTTSMAGAFKDDPELRRELHDLLKISGI